MVIDERREYWLAFTDEGKRVGMVHPHFRGSERMYQVDNGGLHTTLESAKTEVENNFG